MKAVGVEELTSVFGGSSFGSLLERTGAQVPTGGASVGDWVTMGHLATLPKQHNSYDTDGPSFRSNGTHETEWAGNRQERGHGGRNRED